MYLINQIKTVIKDYLFAIHDYGFTRKWNFNGLVELGFGKKVNLFATDFNMQINQIYKGNELFFLAFHANRFNPHENNLFVLFFEIYDKIIHKETEIFLVKYHIKPYIIEGAIFTGIPCESVYSPAFRFQKDILLLDAEKATKELEETALLNLRIKALLRKETEKISLLYMFERILQKEGFVASFLQHLFDKNQINVNKVKLNQAHFSFLTRSLNSEIIHEFSAKDYSQLENLFYSLEVEINYRATQEKFTQKATKLMLAPVLNEMYLKLFEYFVDSEFPFICQHLLRNIRVNPKNTSVIYKANQLLQAN